MSFWGEVVDAALWVISFFSVLAIGAGICLFIVSLF